MTLRKVAEDYSRGIAPRTASKITHQLNRWEKYGLQKRAKSVTTEDFEKLRTAATADGLAATSIEDTVSDVLTLLRFALKRVDVPDAGRRLKRKFNCKPVPSLDEMASAYAASCQAKWPSNPRTLNVELREIDNEVFWQAWIVFSFWTGLRLGDVMRVEWDGITHDKIEVTASKTSKKHTFPLPEVVAVHLERLRSAGLSRPFPISKWSVNRVRRELDGMGSNFGPQAIRRASITTWACASPEAGRIVHGERLGVLRHYYDTCRILAEAAPRFQWPSAILEGAGMTQQTQRRAELLAVLNRVPDNKIDDVLTVTRALSGN